ncbi:MAG: hypothetical protein ACK2UI_08755, partial [Anaerolineae bacterium]
MTGRGRGERTPGRVPVYGRHVHRGRDEHFLRQRVDLGVAMGEGKHRGVDVNGGVGPGAVAGSGSVTAETIAGRDV